MEFGVDPIDGTRQLAILFGNGVAGIVCGQVDLYGIPDVAPVGMMVHLFRMESYFGHEGKGFGKVAEFKGSLKLVVFFCPHKMGG